MGRKTFFGGLISKAENEQSTSYRDNRKTGPQKVATISKPEASVPSVSGPHHPSNNISTPEIKTPDLKHQWKAIDQNPKIEGQGETTEGHQGPEEQHLFNNHHMDAGSAMKQLVLEQPDPLFICQSPAYSEVSSSHQEGSAMGDENVKTDGTITF